MDHQYSVSRRSMRTRSKPSRVRGFQMKFSSVHMSTCTSSANIVLYNDTPSIHRQGAWVGAWGVPLTFTRVRLWAGISLIQRN